LTDHWKFAHVPGVDAADDTETQVPNSALALDEGAVTAPEQAEASSAAAASALAKEARFMGRL
jgi:hypothetical protein